MKILLVAMSDSIHTVRWISQLAGQGWDVRLFPSINHGAVHPELRGIPVYHTLTAGCHRLDRKLRWQGNVLFARSRALLGTTRLHRLWPQWRLRQLLRVIDAFRPDVIHALEFQAAGYLIARAKKARGGAFPPWIVTNWGSDIYHFRQFPVHEKKIREVLKLCDYYSCECRRDVCLAEGMGLKGRVLPVIPNTGGFDVEALERLRQPGPVSGRRTIVLKGYQHWAGRALVALAALELCAESLTGYEVVIHSATPETIKSAALFHKNTGVSVIILPKGTPHASILAAYGRARLGLGLSLSDGISTSFLEALVMGAFPIQSRTACADEWIADGESGLLVPPEDAAAVASAVRRALTEDTLVDRASEINAVTARKRLSHKMIGTIAAGYYLTAAGGVTRRREDR